MVPSSDAKTTRTPKEPKRPKVRVPSESAQSPEFTSDASLGAAAHSKMEASPSISSSTESSPTERILAGRDCESSSRALRACIGWT